MNNKNLVLAYAGVAVGVAVTSVAVLVKDGKDSPSKIAYYAVSNGLLWPGAIIVMARKAAELEAARG
jgi:hypothetical protein